MAAQSWTFLQLGGPTKRLVLKDYAAPFGRPRQKPIFEEMFQDRVKTVHYPGQSNNPTRHRFGTKWADEGIQFTGRWMDKQLPDKTAEQMVNDWQAFISDEQPVRISWGSILSFVGFIESLKCSWESDKEVAWTMTVLVDRKEVTSGFVEFGPQPSRPSRELVDIYNQNFLANQKRLTAVENDLSPGFFDSLNNLTSSLASVTSTFVKLAGDLNDLQQQTFDVLQRFRLAIGQVRTALVLYRRALDSASINSQLFSRQADSDLHWFQFKNASDVELSVMLDILSQLDRGTAVALRGKGITAYQARQGDTWESISNKFFQGPDHANEIRQANGIQYGNLPVVGQTYSIPQTSVKQST